jgi:hypothetical protein
LLISVKHLFIAAMDGKGLVYLRQKPLPLEVQLHQSFTARPITAIPNHSNANEFQNLA